MSELKEMAAEYRLAAAKMRIQIQRMQEAGAPQSQINECRMALHELRDTSRLLSGYYDTPRVSSNAAVRWYAGKKRRDQ